MFPRTWRLCTIVHACLNLIALSAGYTPLPSVTLVSRRAWYYITRKWNFFARKRHWRSCWNCFAATPLYCFETFSSMLPSLSAPSLREVCACFFSFDLHENSPLLSPFGRNLLLFYPQYRHILYWFMSCIPCRDSLACWSRRYIVCRLDWDNFTTRHNVTYPVDLWELCKQF